MQMPRCPREIPLDWKTAKVLPLTEGSFGYHEEALGISKDLCFRVSEPMSSQPPETLYMQPRNLFLRKSFLRTCILPADLAIYPRPKGVAGGGGTTRRTRLNRLFHCLSPFA
jgi:hypothetical protein